MAILRRPLFNELNEVAAGVIETGDDCGADVGWSLPEHYTHGALRFVLGVGEKRPRRSGHSRVMTVLLKKLATN